MKYFDTHAHLGLIHEDPIEQLIIAQEAKQEGVSHIMSICNNLYDFFELYNNLSSAPNVFFAVGVSPSEVQNPGLDWERRITEGLAMDRVVALGETGLDYFKKFGDKNSQVELFVAQLELAEQHEVPVIIHNRNAGEVIREILGTRMPSRGGVLHCYSESRDYAKAILRQHDDIYFSFAGNVTYKNARNLHETVSYLPLDRIVIESESPFMIPAQYKGKRNKPMYIHSVAQFIAEELREEPVEEVYQALYDNAKRLFGLDD